MESFAAWPKDVAYDSVCERQVKAYWQPGGVLAISSIVSAGSCKLISHREKL